MRHGEGSHDAEVAVAAGFATDTLRPAITLACMCLCVCWTQVRVWSLM